jgi:putative Mn2+ efflux pump MntP
MILYFCPEQQTPSPVGQWANPPQRKTVDTPGGDRYKPRMDLLTLLGIAVALAMDAFAVALATGMNLATLTGRHLFRLGFHFGLFQALMPIIGWLAGLAVQQRIAAWDHWIAFGLLAFVGGHMLWEAFTDDDAEAQANDPTRGLSLVLLSVATSIDALAVGFSLSVLGVSIWMPAVVIGLVAGALTVAGMLLGRRVGDRWGPRVEIVGGLILIGIGLKILAEHLLG